MIQIDRAPEGGYVMQTDGVARTIPTFVDLVREMLTEFGVRGETDGHQKPHDEMKLLAEMVDCLHKYDLPARKFVRLLTNVQSTGNSNIPTPCKSNARQMQIADLWLATLREAQPFDYLNVRCERLGGLYEFDYNGRVGVSKKGHRNDLLFLKKDDVSELKTVDKRTLETVPLPDSKKQVLIEYIETLKDRDMGILPIVHVNTRIPADSGELDVAEFEAGGGTAGTEEEYNETEN